MAVGRRGKGVISLRHLSPLISIRRHTRYGFDADRARFRA